jgi:hypothetical protein
LAYFRPLRQKRIDAEHHIALRASWVTRVELGTDEICARLRESPNRPLLSIVVPTASVTRVTIAAIEDVDGVWHHSIRARYARGSDGDRSVYVPLLVTAVDRREEAWDLVFRIARALGLRGYRDVGDGPDGDIRIELEPDMRASEGPYRGATSDVRAVPEVDQVADYAAASNRAFVAPEPAVPEFEPEAAPAVRVDAWNPGERVHLVRPWRATVGDVFTGALFAAFIFGYVAFYALAIVGFGGALVVGFLASFLWLFGIEITPLIEQFAGAFVVGISVIAGFAGAASYISDGWQAARSRSVVIDWSARTISIAGQQPIDFDVVLGVSPSDRHGGSVEILTRTANIEIVRGLGNAHVRPCAADLARALDVPYEVT